MIAMQLEISTDKCLSYASVTLLEDNYRFFLPCHLTNSLMFSFTKKRLEAIINLIALHHL